MTAETLLTCTSEFCRVSKRKLAAEELLLFLGSFIVFLFVFFIIDSYTFLWYLSMIIVAAGYIFFAVCYFPVRYKNTGYLFCDDFIYYKTGFFFVKTSCINRQRLLYASLIKTPLTPVFSIVHIVIKAAGMKMVLSGLSLTEARRMLRQLVPACRLD